MTKGELMDLVYPDPQERGNIDAGIPHEYYDGKDPEIQVDKWSHVMNFNKPNHIFGKLENMLEVAKERGIKIPD